MMKETLIKGVLSGAVCGVATSYVFGNGSAPTISIGGMDVNAALLTAGGVGIGSVVSDVFSDQIEERFNMPTNVKNIEHFAVQAGVAGAISTGVLLGLGGLPMQSAVPAFLLGSASKLSGDYIFTKVLDPQTGMLPMF